MKIFELEQDIFMYNFEPNEIGNIGTNIFAIINGNECCIIDSGYFTHFEQMRADLESKNISITSIILTHFHPDHIGGIKELPGVESYGSIDASITLSQFFFEYKVYLPKHSISEPTKMTFGRHQFLLENNRGHSIDGMLITLNNTYVFVGDDIMINDSFDISLPYVAYKGPNYHLAALNTIRNTACDKTILPSHGVPIKNRDLQLQIIQNIETYLIYIREHDDCLYDQFYQETKLHFFNQDWHLDNINNIKGE